MRTPPQAPSAGDSRSAPGRGARGRVLHLAWEFPPVVYGGLARHVDELSRAQHGAGWEVTVITPAEDVTDPGRRVPAGPRGRRGVRVLRARRRLPRSPWTDVLAAAGELEDAMSAAGHAHLDALAAAGAQGPAVVHAHDWIGARAARSLARRSGARLVLTVHATEHGRRLGAVGSEVDGGLPAAIHALEREAVAAADAVIVCSASMRVEVCEVLDAAAERVVVVPNAVDARSWRAGPAAVRAARRHWLPPAEGGLLIAAAGRIEWEKGFSTVVRALPDLRRAHPRLRFVLAGRGSYLPTLTALATQLGVAGQVVLPGMLSRRDLAALFAAADVVVVPSRYEPSGLVAREAQAAGGRVVSTRVGGLVEAVTDGRSGLLIDVGDVHGLQDAISLLAAHPDRARRIALAGAAAVRSSGWPDVARWTAAVYAGDRSPDRPEEPRAQPPGRPPADRPERPSPDRPGDPPADRPERPSPDRPGDPPADRPERPSPDRPGDPPADPPDDRAAGRVTGAPPAPERMVRIGP